ncbi:MAG: response regulator transcription factor [Lachnospiraceae bacterium]|nr:response regulator transcription factor [Lachnospiraceae bacterium]
MEMFRVLLVDDETMLLDSLEIILSLNDMEIVGKAHDGNEALEILTKVSCDIALVDLNMKGMGGIELIGHMKKLYPQTRILVLTTFYDDANITNAISGGADGYLLKDSGKDAILGAIRQIMGGISVLDPKVMQRLTTLVVHSTTKENVSEEQAYGELTEREREIASLLAEGLTNRQIADRLYISEGTVKNYISAIYDKTGIHDRVKLVVALKG